VTARPLNGLAFALVALGFLSTGNAVAPDDTLVRGLMQSGDASGIWTFRRCGDAADLPIMDKTAGEALSVAVAEIKRGMPDPRRSVFVEFQGSVSRDDAVARRLWRVLGHVNDCAKLPSNIASDAKLWATGNDPAWLLVVRGSSATFTRFGGVRLAFAAAPLTPRMPRRSYEAQSGPTHLRIEIDEELCLDPIAEAAYGARVTATVRERSGTQSLRGCAARY
jgi:uncharacterized membrane protein